MKVEMCAGCRGHGKILIMLPSAETMETFCPDCEGDGLVYDYGEHEVR